MYSALALSPSLSLGSLTTCMQERQIRITGLVSISKIPVRPATKALFHKYSIILI